MMRKKFEIFLLFFFLILIFSGGNSYAQEINNFTDASFKTALTKVVFFISLALTISYLVKRYSVNKPKINDDKMFINILEERVLSNNCRISLLEIEGRKIVIASHPTANISLSCIDKLEVFSEKRSTSLSVLKNEAVNEC